MHRVFKEIRPTLSERFVRGLGILIDKTVQRPRLCSAKPVPEVPSIFICSHVGLIDPVVLMAEYHPRVLRPLVAKDYFDKNGFTRWFFRSALGIPIERRQASASWLKEALAALDRGESIIIFPEGTRNKSGHGLLPFRGGAALLAARSGAPLIPVYNAPWHFPHRYRLAIGAPFQTDALPPEGETAEWLRAQTKKMEEAVAALIPLTGADTPDAG